VWQQAVATLKEQPIDPTVQRTTGCGTSMPPAALPGKEKVIVSHEEANE
jgi:hypothetical protein